VRSKSRAFSALELAQAPNDGRLAHAQGAGRLAQTARVGHGEEDS
jgi:hypothetical protein